jgi:hypothetical protein
MPSKSRLKKKCITKKSCQRRKILRTIERGLIYYDVRDIKM